MTAPTGARSLPTETMPRNSRTRLWLLLCAAAAAFSLWMRAALPVYVFEDAAYDDGLFVRLARSIGEGRWLGAYDGSTLVKGAFYSIFIAAAHAACVPLKVAEQAVYIGASFAFASVLSRRLRHGQAFGALLFALLCANPMLWCEDFERVIRDGLYVGLAIAVVGLTALVAFPIGSRRTSASLATGLSLGLVAGAFWTTREEGVILVPTVATIAAVGFARQALRMQAGPRSLSIRRPWGTALPWSAAALGFASVTATISALNFERYGVFETVEVKQAAFVHAYGALSRIKPDHWQRYVVFPEDARRRAYAASPAARELEPVLDGPVGQAWARQHCVEAGIDPCTGVHAGWFQWVFREAVAHAGHYASAPEAEAYYGRLAAEIDAACEDGRLDCLPPRATLAPPFQLVYLRDTWVKAKLVFRELLLMGSDERHLPPSAVYRGAVDAVADVVGPIIMPSTPRLVARGWAGAFQSRPSIQVRSHRFDQFDTSVYLSAAPDVELYYPGLQAVRFAIGTNCPPADCDLVLGWPDRPEVAVPMTAFANNAALLHEDVKLQIDEASTAPASPLTDDLRAVQGTIAKRVARFYAAACRALLAPACAGLLLAAVFRRRAGVPAVVHALAAGCASAVVCRVVLLAYLDVTSIPFNYPYLVTASPFLIAFVALGLYAGVAAAAGVLRSRRGAAEGSRTAREAPHLERA